MFKRSTIAVITAVALSAGNAAIAEDIDIVFVGKNTGNPYFDSLTDGFVDACEVISCNFEFVAPATADATILPTDFTKVGADQVEIVGSLIGYEGEVAILSATTEAPDQNFWIEGMNETIANDAKYANMTLVATVYGDDQPEKSTTEMEALLANFPDLKGVIAPTTVGIAAAAQVVQSRGISDTVKVTGLGLPSEMRDFVKDGTVEGFQLWSPYNQGWLAAHFAVGLKDGSMTNEVGATFDVPNLGTITINENNSINTQSALTTFNADNIDDFDF